MASKFTDRAPYEAMEASDKPPKPSSMAHLTLTMIVRDRMAIPFAPDGVGIGALIESHVTDALAHGNVVQSVTFELPEDYWGQG